MHASAREATAKADVKFLHEQAVVYPVMNVGVNV
jgi:hypothetical protein